VHARITGNCYVKVLTAVGLGSTVLVPAVLIFVTITTVAAVSVCTIIIVLAIEVAMTM
jgi:hypothetical protein